MMKLFTSLKGTQVLLQVVTLAVGFMIFTNTIVEESVKDCD